LLTPALVEIFQGAVTTLISLRLQVRQKRPRILPSKQGLNYSKLLLMMFINLSCLLMKILIKKFFLNLINIQVFRNVLNSHCFNLLLSSMAIYKRIRFLVFISVCLLLGCGGGGNSPDAPVVILKEGYAYMAGGYVEGLTYTTETQEGTTGPEGQFKYQAGETVTFKVGNQTLSGYAIQLIDPKTFTHFQILKTFNPNATVIKNLSVLLHMLDDDGNLLNGIKLSASRLEVANRVTDSLQAETYLAALEAEAIKARIAVPNLGAVLASSTSKTNNDKVFIKPYASGTASFNEFNSVITLSADGSADANSDNLTYNWTIASKPKSSQAVIVNPTSSAPTLVADAFDEPYIFRLVVSDSLEPNKVKTDATEVTVTAARNPIAGVYTQKLDANTRQLVVITDTSEIWGYALSSSTNRSRRFSGPVARADVNLPQYAATALTHQTTLTCPSPCDDRIDLAANFLEPSSISITNEWAKNFLFDTAGSVQLATTSLSNQPILITSLAGTYREKDSAPDSKDWKITAKGEINFYKTLADNKLTLCAIGQIAIDKQGQVLNRQGFVTRHIVPVSIEFKNECDENFDPNTFSTGFLVPDPTLGIAGYSFIGRNESRSRYFLRHFIKL
jgi:hypothetical protein